MQILRGAKGQGQGNLNKKSKKAGEKEEIGRNRIIVPVREGGNPVG